VEVEVGLHVCCRVVQLVDSTARMHRSLQVLPLLIRRGKGKGGKMRNPLQSAFSIVSSGVSGGYLGHRRVHSSPSFTDNRPTALPQFKFLVNYYFG